VLQLNASTMPMSTTIQEVIDRFNANLAKQMKDDYGIEVKKNKNLSYRKPYPSSFDLVSYPIGWRCPEFVKFNGDDSKTTWENVSQYLAQLGEASVTEEIKVHLFSLSLTDNVFLWFASLPVNSIRTCEQLKKFHGHFYSRDNELRLSHLTNLLLIILEGLEKPRTIVIILLSPKGILLNYLLMVYDPILEKN
jgi:hypothetical protein